MGAVMAEVLERDLALYQDHARGMRKVQLAEKYDLDRHTVAAVIDRVKSTLPPVDRSQVFDQSLEMVDDLLAVYQPMAMDGDKAAGRLVDRLIGRRNALLGLENAQKLELFMQQQEARHEPIDVRTELAALLTRIRNGGTP